MSEDFDKEAERERLREKYESDAEGREVTERMSQLLLQGATMTNKHCDTCGSPIFRYQGQAFCPTCQAERAEGGDGQATDAQAGETSTNAAAKGQAAESGTATAQSGQAEPGQSAQAERTQSAQAERTQSAQAGRNDNVAHESVGAPSTGTAELGGGSRSQQGTSAGQPANSITATGNAADVTTSLAQTITNLSERARQSEDPRQAKTLLEAAREAAETLVTLQGR